MIERLPPPSPCAGSPATAGVYEDVNVSAEIDGLGNMQGTAEAGGGGRGRWRGGGRERRGEAGVYPHSNTQADKKKKAKLYGCRTRA